LICAQRGLIRYFKLNGTQIFALAQTWLGGNLRILRSYRARAGRYAPIVIIFIFLI
jgi:hypothetical protein